MPVVVAVLLIVLIVWPPLAVGSLAQQSDVLSSGRRVVRAERMTSDERIELDGVLDEPVWKRAVSAGEFTQQDPVLGAQPTERVEKLLKVSGAWDSFKGGSAS